ncbi:hypothetical protein SKTS_21740 [Sulfurimicrobium lacus]|uniref:Uncharacterized protein n=1 Tax=Sulfurimicrobium lacus TaxID=2715678 RepID=A0A6F8VC40_9PROT|nr:hypothetical protein [Sulfurimicrobium lacus]BCB27288.1 hypothetical protein SKTS_21740 [Sulfurimicrobium lacus]
MAVRKSKKHQLTLFPGPVAGDIPYPIHINYDDGQGWKSCDVHRALHVLSLFYPAHRIDDLLATGRPVAVAVGGRSVYFARPCVGVELPTTFWQVSSALGAERPERGTRPEAPLADRAVLAASYGRRAA